MLEGASTKGTTTVWYEDYSQTLFDAQQRKRGKLRDRNLNDGDRNDRERDEEVEARGAKCLHVLSDSFEAVARATPAPSQFATRYLIQVGRNRIPDSG